jgi:hypothetical protein
MVDWAILEYIKVAQLSSKMEKIKRDDKELVWINYKHLIKSMPLIKITNTAAISNRLKNLHDLGLIHKYKKPATDKLKCNRVYCCVSNKTVSITEFRKVHISNNEGVPISNKDHVYTSKDNKNTNISKLKHKVSKDTRESKKDSLDQLNQFLKKNPFTKKCIDVWNEYPFTQNITTSHKTKLIIKLDKYVKQLLNGTFTTSRDNKTFDVDWFKGNSIPVPFKKLTKKEILVTIKRTALYKKDGYFTEDKYNMPKDLPSLMYNSRTGKSWFLLAYYKEPKPFNIPIADPDPETSEYLIGKMNGAYDSSKNADKIKLFNGIKSFAAFIDNIPETSLRIFKINSELGTHFRIAKEYVYWLEHQDFIDEISLPILNTDNKLWRRFIKEKQEDYGGYKLQ